MFRHLHRCSPRGVIFGIVGTDNICEAGSQCMDHNISSFPMATLTNWGADVVSRYLAIPMIWALLTMLCDLLQCFESNPGITYRCFGSLLVVCHHQQLGWLVSLGKLDAWRLDPPQICPKLFILNSCSVRIFLYTKSEDNSNYSLTLIHIFLLEAGRTADFYGTVWKCSFPLLP